MKLSDKQKDSLRTKSIEICDEILELMKDKELNIDIPLTTYFNEYGNLVLKISYGGISYTTNKTRGRIFVKWDDMCTYQKLKNGGYMNNTDILLDILKNKDLIIATIKHNIAKTQKMLDELLG